MNIKRKITARIYDRTIARRVMRLSLTQQVALVRGMMIMPGTMPMVRKNMLEGLPEDIKKAAEQGKSKEQIKDYYWNCEAFKKLWQDLEMQEATLDELIRGCMETE